MTLPKTQHPYNTDFLCTWAGKTSGTTLYSPLQWADICLSCLSIQKKKVRSLVYFPALTLSQTLWNYTGDDASHCSPFKTLLTAQCGSWKRSMWVPSETYTIGHMFVLHLWPNAAHSSATQWQGEWGVMLRPCTVSLLTAECIQTEWQLLKSCNASANILQNILLQD